MGNMVTISLKDYDELREVINSQKNQIRLLKESRIEELKEIFQIDRSYSSIDIYTDATNIIKELYGEDMNIKGSKYILNKEKVATSFYGIYKIIEEEEEEE